MTIAALVLGLLIFAAALWALTRHPAPAPVIIRVVAVDLFTRQLLTIQAESRVGLRVIDPKAVVRVAAY